MNAPKQRGKLSYKLLFWFLLISLVPVAVVGWHLVDTSLTVLREVSLRNQENLAENLSESVARTVMDFKRVLIETSRLAEFAKMAPKQQEGYLLRVMQLNPAFIDISVADREGAERVRLGRFLQPDEHMEPRNIYETPPFQTALQQHEYIGSLERIQGVRPALTIAVPIYSEGAGASTSTVQAVLIGKVSLTGLSTMLSEELPERGLRQAAVVTLDGFLVAHSMPDRIYRTDPKLTKNVTSFIAKRSTTTGGGEIQLQDGTNVLGAFAKLPELGWAVYVQQPQESAYRAAADMQKQIFRILIWVILITIVLSFAVAAHITLPIRELQAAAEQLRMGRFEELPEMTLTNDEIGDLGQGFLQMSDVLHEKTEELMRAKTVLEKFRGTLERRVHSRTRELQSAQDELVRKERLAAMGAMASVVGHEIRNPLAVINNSTFFIKTKLTRANALDDRVKKHIGIIESEIQQASSIINEILTYSRSRELNPQEVRLNHFIEETLTRYPFPSHIEVAQQLDPADPTVRIDVEEMRQALRNLIGNAVEVMPGRGSLFVITEVIDPGWVRMSVKDTGPGIPPDVLDQMFQPFYTTKASGTGLGLAVVRKVMDRHDGRVDCVTEIGKGALFRLYLPIHKGTATEGVSLPPLRPKTA